MSETDQISNKLPGSAQFANETEDFQSLTNFVLSSDLAKLEKLLSGFNLFQTLGLESKELAHARVLTWLLQPEESHGLGDLFLRRWLMRVVSETDSSDPKLPAAPDVEVAEWVQVDVEPEVALSREERLDVVVTLRERGVGGEPLWIVAIELKVDSKEREDQLSRYREILTKRFPTAIKQVLVFLTKDEQSPSDSAWTRCGFAVILCTLKECLSQRAETMGAGPRLLLENYKNLLEEKFVENTRIASAVRNIIRKHPEAIELILKHKTDPLQDWTRELRRELSEKGKELGIIVKDGSGKDYVEFSPLCWSPQLKLKKAKLLCVLQIFDDGVGLRIYVTNHCDLVLKRELVKLAEENGSIFQRGTPRKEEAAQPTLESEWWHDFHDENRNSTAVIEGLGNDIKSGRLRTLFEMVAQAVNAAPNSSSPDGGGGITFAPTGGVK